MSYLKAVFAAEARVTGRGVRTVTVQHRHLARDPLALVTWQLGAEPFSAAAIAWGIGPGRFDLAVAGEPRNRPLAFRALRELARFFNPWFERSRAGDAPQIVVPNAATLAHLGRLGRRLAFLSTDGDVPAPPELIRLGLHLLFLARHALVPGQQLVVVLTDLVRANWAVDLSDLEQTQLPALDAAIAPPPGLTGHQAAVRAEMINVGPTPSDVEDGPLDELLEAFHRARGGRTDDGTVQPLLAPFHAHYRKLVATAWPILWRALDRERALPEAPHAATRWGADVEAHQRHLAWVAAQGGRYSARDTARRAAMTLRREESAARVLAAQEALDDPLRMAAYVLTNEAIVGRVVEVDLDHCTVLKRRVARPRFVVETDEPVSYLRRDQLYWSDDPRGREYAVVDLTPVRGGEATRITLEHQTGSKTLRPTKGDSVVFSVHHLGNDFRKPLAPTPPWTHAPAPTPTHIETTDEEATLA